MKPIIDLEKFLYLQKNLKHEAPKLQKQKQVINATTDVIIMTSPFYLRIFKFPFLSLSFCKVNEIIIYDDLFRIPWHKCQNDNKLFAVLNHIFLFCFRTDFCITLFGFYYSCYVLRVDKMTSEKQFLLVSLVDPYKALNGSKYYFGFQK